MSEYYAPFDDVVEQLERYGGSPAEVLLPFLWAITDLNDDIKRGKDLAACGSLEKVEAALDNLKQDLVQSV
jgi:hypothetical protein